MALPNKFSNLSLRAKLLLTVGIFLAGVSLFVAWYLPAVRAERAERAFLAKAEVIAGLSSEQFSAMGRRGGHEKFTRLAERLMDTEPLTAFAVVFDSANTRVLGPSHNLAVPESLLLAGVLPGALRVENTHIIRNELRANGAEVGIAYFFFDRAQLRDEKERYANAVLEASLAFLAAALAILFLTATIILRPLTKIGDVVELAAKGEMHARVAVPFNDETARLATSVNALVLKLEASYKQTGTLTALLDKREAQIGEELERRREVERQVQLSNEIINKVSALILVANSTGGIVYASPAFEPVLGFKPEELQDDGWWKLSRVSVEDRVRERNLAAKHARRELRLSTIPYERRIVNARGEPRWILWQDTLGFNNTIIGVGHDITERKHAEEQIREQAALLDITGDAILVRNLDHKILYWNRGAELLYGISPDEARARSADELFQEEGLSGVGLAYATVVENGNWSGELKQRTKAGKQLIVESRWTLMNDEHGRPRSILVVNTDVTEQRLLEAQFRRAQRLENIGTLAGGIAHDLNNVLTPIIMAIQALQKKNLDAKSQQMLSTIGLSARRGADIVKQVLTFARGSEGERMLLQPKHILREVEQITRETFPRSLELNFDFASQLWTISGDATQLHQIFLNLLVNARDAMPNGGKLTIRAENVTIDEHEARRHHPAKPGNYVVLSVADTGSGIRPEVLERIYDPFFTTKEVGKGTGLGLSTVLSIVKSYDGFIVVNTELGKGTEFRIHLPATYADAGAGQEDGAKRQIPAGKGETILVVDDEASIREIIKETLEVYGYRAVTAKDGVEALAIIDQERGRVRLVVTDIMMPSMDGASLTRTLSRMAPEIKIIVVTGMADHELLEKVKSAKIEALLPKPIQTEQLLAIIDSAIHADAAGARAEGGNGRGT